MSQNKKSFPELLGSILKDGVDSAKGAMSKALSDAKDVIDLKMAEKKRLQLIESILEFIVYNYRDTFKEIEGIKDLYLLLDVYDKQIKALKEK